MRFIKLYEKMTEWEWYDDLITFKVFIHLLLTANWKDTSWHGIDLKRGQRVISYQTLADELHLTPKQVRTAIEKLKRTHEVASYMAGKRQVVTIENYEKYQGRDSDEGKVEGREVGRQRATDIEDIELYRKKIPTVSKKVPSKDDVEEIVKAYNEICVSLPHVLSISDDRVKKTRARLSKHNKHELILAFQKAEASDFATGRSGEGNKWCNFDWLMRSENNLVKMLEGNYDNKENHGTNGNNKSAGRSAPRVTDKERQSIAEWEARQRELFAKG